MDKRKSPKQLAKFISYMLGRRPDEFGLVPDTNGFVKIKELVKAICEEEGLGYVRRFHINEILMTLPDPPIEVSDSLARAKSRKHIPARIPVSDPPKLLYTCVRRKAHPFVMDKGIFPSGRRHVILSSEKKMAERIGKRIDQIPVLLTVQTRKSFKNGVVFYKAGDLLYIADSIPVGCFTGPPLPKEKVAPKKEDSLKKEKNLPGTFLMNLTEEKNRDKRSRHERKRKEIAWKKERKKMKRKKENMWDI